MLPMKNHTHHRLPDHLAFASRQHPSDRLALEKMAPALVWFEQPSAHRQKS